MTENKYEHVRKSKQTRGHTCHWIGCTDQVPPAMWGCKTHWFMLPASIRAKIWATYRAGQEETGNVSAAYYAAAQEAEKYIKYNTVTTPTDEKPASDHDLKSP